MVMTYQPGIKFGDWTLVEHASGTLKKKMRWIMRCVCGETRNVSLINVERGGSRNCGCKRKKTLSRVRTKHGLVHTPTYSSWAGMKDRCNRKEARQWHDYGGRGISYCEEWEYFENFLRDMGLKPKDKSLGRIDNDLGYSPENCRWETSEQQNRNKRNNRFLEHDGKRMTISEWSYSLGMRNSAVGKRLKRGWSIEKALTHPTPPV